MRTSTERLLTALGVLAFFVPQFWLVHSQPSWGLYSPFPFTIQRSIGQPILLGLSAAVLAWEKSVSPSQRKLLYWIIAASVAEIVTIRAMLWFGQPLLLLAVFLLNAFMAVQLLRFGISWFLAKSDQTVRTKSHEAASAKTPAGRKPATVRGMIFRFGLAAVGFIAFGHFWAPSVPLTVQVEIVAAVLAPGIILAIILQVRLRKSLSRAGKFDRAMTSAQRTSDGGDASTDVK